MRRPDRIATIPLAGMALFLLALPVLPRQAAAQESVFNLGGFGIPASGESLRGRALGGAGLGLDVSAFSVENPAGLAGFRVAGIYLSVLGQRTDIEAPEGSGEFEDVVFPMGQVVVPAGDRFALAAGYSQFLDFDAGIVGAIVLDGDTVPVSLDAEGGISTLSPAVAYALDDRTSLGLSLDVFLGSREVVRTVGLDEVEEGALETADTLARDFRALGATLGIERRVGERIRLSAAYRLRPTVSSEITLAPGEGLVGQETDLDLPDELVVGATARVSEALLLAAAGRWSGWGDFETEGVPEGRMGDAAELGGGLEWRPQSVLYGLLGPEAPLRLGARWRRLPLELQGEPVTEWSGTVGYGRRFGGRSSIDVVFEVGTRGALEDHGLSESFLRLGVGLSTFEEWRRRD